MFYIRTTKTSSSRIAIQVVRYENRKTVVVRHIGSARNNSEVLLLKQAARDWIEKTTGQKNLLVNLEEKEENQILQIKKCKYLGVKYSFVYQIIYQLFRRLKFTSLNNKLLLDLVLMRILEPASKLQTLELLHDYFGITYEKSKVYKAIFQFFLLKETVEEKVIAFARSHLNFNFTVVFYDITTLYFETFTDDNLRKRGFSKDNKIGQPQILIGLIVNEDGFPVSFEVFAGNKFEGHTLLPSMLSFKKKYGVKNLTVVADAAMISKENINLLQSNDLSYIVGARLGSLKKKTIKTISSKLNQMDGQSLRIKTEPGFLICDFSLKRYQKDKHEMEKQLQKAENIIKSPMKERRRNKFVKYAKNIEGKLNQELIKKTTCLLGIKGYYTNLVDLRNEFIIKHYHSLWNIEKSFRITKSDLKIRPVYHFKDQAIKAHVLICFMALVVCKLMEIKTGRSTQKILKLFKKITDARILNIVSGEEIWLRMEIPQEVKEILSLLSLSY